VELSTIIGNLLSAIDADNIEAKALELAGEESGDPGDVNRRSAQEQLVGEAAGVFTGKLIELIDGIRREKEQTIDHENLDKVQRAEWDKDTAVNASTMADEFAAYLKEQKDKIEALTIFFSQPHRRQELTFAMINQVLEMLKADKPKLAPLRVWQAYGHLDKYKGGQPISELSALVSLIRRVCGMDKKLTAYDDTVRRNFQNWVLKRHSGKGIKFNEEQMEWLRMIRDHIISSMHIERDDLELAPFDGQGGLGKMHQLFGAKMDKLIDELNEALAA
jgi:type I restriction enzyme R subunit